MNLIDRAFLLHHSPLAAAATLNGGMLHWSFVCLPFAIASFTNTFVAQYHGANEKARIGKVVGQSLLFGMAAIPLFFLTIPVASFVFRTFKRTLDADALALASAEDEYFVGLAYGGGAFVLEAALSAYFTGRGRTRIVFVGSLMATLTNLVLDYGLIFGEWGMPRWGVFGAGFATALSHWAAVATFIVFASFESDRADYALLRGMAFDWPLWKRWLRYAIPGALPMIVESVAFTALLLLISGEGGLATAATTIAFSLNGVSFAPMIGVGIAVSTLVGQHLGANEPKLAERAVWSGLAIGLTYSVACGTFYLTTPETMLRFHRFSETQTASPDANEDVADTVDAPQLKSITIVLLRFISAYCLFDAAQIILSNALKGAGDTTSVLVITGGVSALHIVGGMALVRAMTGPSNDANGNHGLYLWWIVLTSWLFSLSAAYLVRFLGRAWQSMRVIEPKLVDATQ